jgi:hypothetical protein
MDASRLAELAGYYDEFLHADPKLAGTRQARFLFEALVRDEYALQPESFKARVTMENFKNQTLIPELDAYLEKKQTQFPTVTPEKIQTKK